MTNKDLNRLRNRPKNLTKAYSESLLMTQESSQGFDAVLTSGKVSDSDNFINLVKLLLGFMNLIANMKFFKRIIRNLYFERYYLFLFINYQVVSINLPKFYTYK
jgi:hypothetical protein